MNRKHPDRISNSRIALSILAILATSADAQALTDWDLPGQPLANSLRAIAARSDSNILFDRKVVGDQSARPLKIRASAEEALEQLLEGTGLTYRQLDEKTVTIQLASTDPSATTNSMPRIGDGRLRLAQAEAQKVVGPEERDSILQGRQLLDIEEIIVTGTNIRGIENSTAPVIVLTREYIDASGFGNTTQLIESLPQNFALANQSSVSTADVRSSGEQGSSINLRGIGEGTTLVLLNGRRLAPGFRSAAVDISALPLTALERVEVLTDGASAVYGSDAVGGVVNFILREDFEGAETRLRSGFADGTDEIRVSQALGSTWDSGNALFSGEYYKRDGLLAADRDFVPSNSLIGGLLPEDENYSAVFTGNQQVGGEVSLFADVIYTQRDSSNQAGRTTFLEAGEVDNSQGNATLGLEWQIGPDWQIELSGSYGRNDLNVQAGGIDPLTGAPRPVAIDTLFESEAARLKADGTLFKLPGGNVRAALGADWRSEAYEDSTVVATVLQSAVASDQTVRSAFAEVYAPLVGPGNAMEGVQRLELSLAGRYDDYSNFGSSFDPQYGLMWEPVKGFRLRGRYGTSYKAPNLADYSFALTSAAAITDVDPADPTGFSYQLQTLGTNVSGLDAQESKSTSIGVEFLPTSAEGFALSLNYYKIEYRNRIADPPQSPAVLLSNPAAFANLIIRNPTPDQVNQIIAAANRGQGFFPFDPVTFEFYPGFTPDQVAVILDLRRRNLSVVDTSGLDLSTQYEVKAGQGRIVLGLAGTYVLDLERQITATSTPFDAVDTFGNPPEWRARGFISWQQGGWATNLFVNHTDAYVDNRPIVPTKVSSYTTVDARLSYSFSERFSTGVLSGLGIAASVQNVLDEDPPGTGILNPAIDLGFDTTNASPLGRFIALEITKAW